MEHWYNNNQHENIEIFWENPAPVPLFPSTINPTWATLKLNVGLCSEKPVINCLSSPLKVNKLQGGTSNVVQWRLCFDLKKDRLQGCCSIRHFLYGATNTVPADTAHLKCVTITWTTQQPRSLSYWRQLCSLYHFHSLPVIDIQFHTASNKLFIFFTISTADDFTPHVHLKPDNGVVIKQETHPLPPYNGYGTYEDSAANCRNIIPVPPHRDFNKLFSKDRYSCVVWYTYVLRRTKTIYTYISCSQAASTQYWSSIWLWHPVVQVNWKELPDTCSGAVSDSSHSCYKIYDCNQSIL